MRLMVGSSKRDPAIFALRSGRIGGATHLASTGATQVQIQQAGQRKIQVFREYVSAVDEGAYAVSIALAT